MILENQVTSLELSQKLKELGVKQESLYYWNPVIKELWSETFNLAIEESPINRVPAYTVAELGELLHYDSFGNMKKITDKDKPFVFPAIGATTEADTRAKMLIYLIENNLITL